MNLPAFTIPSPVARAVSMLPTFPPSFVLSKVLNLALGRLIAPAALEPLHGKQIAIHVTDAGLKFFFSIGSKGFVARKSGGTPDLSFSATAHDFYLLATRKEDPDTLFFSRRLLVEGDTELGLIAKNTLDAVEMPKFDVADLMPRKVLGRLFA